MPRPMGSYLEPSAKRATGRQETHGTRPARDALARDEPLRGLALQAQQAALERYELDGSYELALENASRIQAVGDVFWAATVAAIEDNKYTLAFDLATRLVGFLTRATQAWGELEGLRRVKDGAMLDYEQVLERDRD